MGEIKMERKSKYYFILTSIILASFLFGSIVTAVSPEEASLLEKVWNTIFGIEAQVDTISTDVTELKIRLDLLERIYKLEIRIALLENSGTDTVSQFPSPSYDSGWRQLPAATPSSGSKTILIHNLDTTEYFVYYIVTEEIPTGLEPFVPRSFHNFGDGSAFSYEPMLGKSYYRGTYWTATKNSIVISRYGDDQTSNYARVMLWKIP